MSQRKIVQAGESVLRSTAKEIPLTETGSAHIQKLIADMKALLAKEEYGVALAAPQVGESLRLFIISGKALEKRAEASRKRKVDEPHLELQTTPKDSKLSTGQANYELQTAPDQVYINPILLKLSRGKKEKHEGCLSVRGKWGMVPRAEKASIQAYDEHGKKFTRGASGLLAHIYQHEMDHLEGILYTDKAKELFDESTEGGRQDS
ncbi:MAG: peptide deformylase [Patescibacteria group bacterium]